MYCWDHENLDARNASRSGYTILHRLFPRRIEDNSRTRCAVLPVVAVSFRILQSRRASTACFCLELKSTLLLRPPVAIRFYGSHRPRPETSKRSQQPRPRLVSLICNGSSRLPGNENKAGKAIQPILWRLTWPISIEVAYRDLNSYPF